MTRYEVLAGSYVFVCGLDSCYKATGLRVGVRGFHVGKNDRGLLLCLKHFYDILSLFECISVIYGEACCVAKS